jgi:hypothetical protein
MSEMFTSMANLTQGDPKMKGSLVVFDPAVFSKTNRLLGDWKDSRSMWKTNFANFLEKFKASKPVFELAMKRENDYLSYLRDGGFESTLASLRTGERKADEDERTQALDFMDAGVNRANFMSGVSNSSADAARRLRVGARIGAEFSGRDAARKRSDVDWANRMKLGTMGKIQSNIDALLKRELMPNQLNDSQLAQMVATLAQIQGVRLGSAQPEFHLDRDTIQKLAGAFDSVVDTAGSLLSAYGGGGYNNPNSGDKALGAMDKPTPSSAFGSSGGYRAGMSYAKTPSFDDEPTGGGGKGIGDRPSWADIGMSL